MLLLARRLLLRHPHALCRYQHRWRHILVDEFQDTNGPQYEVNDLLLTDLELRVGCAHTQPTTDLARARLVGWFRCID